MQESSSKKYKFDRASLPANHAGRAKPLGQPLEALIYARVLLMKRMACEMAGTRLGGISDHSLKG
jgi:hypothetical protein